MKKLVMAVAVTFLALNFAKADAKSAQELQNEVQKLQDLVQALKISVAKAEVKGKRAVINISYDVLFGATGFGAMYFAKLDKMPGVGNRQIFRAPKVGGPDMFSKLYTDVAALSNRPAVFQPQWARSAEIWLGTNSLKYAGAISYVAFGALTLGGSVSAMIDTVQLTLSTRQLLNFNHKLSQAQDALLIAERNLRAVTN